MKRRFHETRFDDATQVKLQIFRRYAREWISVLLTRTSRQFSQLNIYDFFAGPGRDSEGNAGSPVIVVEEVKEFCRTREDQKADLPVRMVFNDSNPDYIQVLRQTIAETRCPKSCCQFEFSAEPFASILPSYLPQMREPGHANLVLMDQFGVKEVTPDTVNTLLDCGSTDILFFISSSFVWRFNKTVEIGSKFRLDPDDTTDSEYKTIHRCLCQYFRSELRVPGTLVTPFSIKKGSNIYGVVFATRSRLGMEKFLRVCWALDPTTGEANYSIDDDPAWGGTRFLLAELNTITRVDIFERALAEHIRQESPTNVELYGFCLEQGFCASEANKALRRLQESGKIAVVDMLTGTAARRGSFYLAERTARARFQGGEHAPHENRMD